MVGYFTSTMIRHHTIYNNLIISSDISCVGVAVISCVCLFVCPSVCVSVCLFCFASAYQNSSIFYCLHLSCLLLLNGLFALLNSYTYLLIVFIEVCIKCVSELNWIEDAPACWNSRTQIPCCWYLYLRNYLVFRYYLIQWDRSLLSI